MRTLNAPSAYHRRHDAAPSHGSAAHLDPGPRWGRGAVLKSAAPPAIPLPWQRPLTMADGDSYADGSAAAVTGLLLPPTLSGHLRVSLRDGDITGRPTAPRPPSLPSRFTSSLSSTTPRRPAVAAHPRHAQPHTVPKLLAPLPTRPRLLSMMSSSPPPLASGSSSFLIPPATPQDAGKLVVVLDLDETLVYSRGITVYERPGVRELLKTLKGRCEVIVWTAGTRDYALEVVRVIDTVCAVQHCIYRHPMWWTGDTGCTKDLRLLGRPMDRVVLVDNTPSVFRANPRNSLLVTDFIVTVSRVLPGASEGVLAALTDIFEQVLRRFSQPSVADVLASRRIGRQVIPLDRGETVELNVLMPSNGAEARWRSSSRSGLTRHAL